MSVLSLLNLQSYKPVVVTSPALIPVKVIIQGQRKGEVKAKFALEQAMKAERESRGITILRL
jgi:hypothetical protein